MRISIHGGHPVLGQFRPHRQAATPLTSGPTNDLPLVQVPDSQASSCCPVTCGCSTCAVPLWTVSELTESVWRPEEDSNTLCNFWSSWCRASQKRCDRSEILHRGAARAHHQLSGNAHTGDGWQAARGMRREVQKVECGLGHSGCECDHVTMSIPLLPSA